jgi:hypothetical protein
VAIRSGSTGHSRRPHGEPERPDARDRKRRLSRGRVTAFAALAAVVVAWYVIAPHLPRIGLWWDIVIVAFLVIPGTLGLVLLALPLRKHQWTIAAAVVLALLAFVFAKLDWGLPGNFAKLWAAVFFGFWFLRWFEELWWVAVIAVIVPVVDAISVWRGPTHAITEHHFEVYTSVAVAFVVPHGGAAYLGPPDILFYALFLAAADRFGLRVFGTWVGTTFMYAMTVIIANAAEIGGLPALPFLSFGFLAVNADLLWRRVVRQRA